MFVDTAKVKLKAGKGGDGAVSFRHEIYIPKGGPDGGDGGRGGSIIFRADKDTNTLLDFRFNPELSAENGKNGSGQRSAGRSGKNLIVEVPIGTIVRRDGKVLADLTHDQEEAVIAKGGDGGFGNAHFKSSTRQTPMVAEVGEPGDEFEATLELRLIADVGLVGLPNAGKSTFLSRVSNARPEIADYPFTTLTPQLGVATVDDQDLLIADIPGLIEGAADGKGLGHDFLRHVDRTAVLLHLIDVYNDDAGAAYEIIRGELERYSDLRDRPEIVALTKCEGVDDEIIEMQRESIREKLPKNRSKMPIFAISSQSGLGLTEVLRALNLVKNAVKTKKQAKNFQKNTEEGPRTAQEQPHTQDGEGVISSEKMVLEGSENGQNSLGMTRETPIKELPVIKLGPEQLSKAWKVEKVEENAENGKKTAKFVVTGQKIEKFARRTDLENYASVNRLRDILKKMGIRAELTSQGAVADSIIEIAGKQFTLVEDY